MTAAGIIVVIFTIGCWCWLALAERRSRKRREAAGPLPRRKRVRYAPAEPLKSHEADEFAALIYAYRYVDVPEPTERSGQ